MTENTSSFSRLKNVLLSLSETEKGSSNSFSRLRSVQLQLSDLEKKVVEYIIKNPEVIIKSTLAKISAECNVSDTTVLRVCRSAGFEGFSDLKISIARDLSSPIREVGDDISEDDDLITIFHKVFQANINSLRDTMETVNKDQFEKAVELLDHANHILIVGVGPSGVIAQDFCEKLIRLKKACRYQRDSYNQLIEASLLGEKDLLVCISLSGTTSDLIDTLKVAKGKKAKSICITGNSTSPIATNSDVVLSVVFRQPWVESMASRVTEFAVIEVLYLVLSIRHLNNALDNEKSINIALANKHVN